MNESAVVVQLWERIAELERENEMLRYERARAAEQADRMIAELRGTAA